MDLRGGLNLIRDSLSYASDSFEGNILIQTGSLEQLKRDHVPEDTCPVCMEEKNNVLLLPCQHQFHADCILKWTERQFACPLCRTEISHFVPLSQMNSEITNAMNHVWERHYVTTQPSSHCNQPEVKFKTTPTPPLSRCPSQAQLRHPSPPSPYSSPPCSTCKMCSNTLGDDYIYMAFDFKFCSSPCRLKYARANRNSKDHDVDGTTSFYVDYSQLEKYFLRGPPKKKAIPAHELSG